LEALQLQCTPETRVVVAYHNYLWDPLVFGGTDRLAQQAAALNLNFAGYSISQPTALFGLPFFATDTRRYLIRIPCHSSTLRARRMPRFCDDIEIIFIEGQSSDGRRRR
jgi:hypothetical protein